MTPLAVLGLIFLGAVGVMAGLPWLAAAAGLVAVLWAAVSIYGRSAEKEITAQHLVTPSHVFPDQPFTVTVQVTNPLPWPVPALDFEDDFPSTFAVEGSRRIRVSFRPQRVQVWGRFAMGRFERVSLHIRVRARERGRFALGPMALTIRDPLGLLNLTIEREAAAVVTVYPRLYPVPAGLWQPLLWRGERRGPPWNPPDPARILGVRPYQPGDPPRLIHPYATARLGSLQVKRLETEADDVVELVILVATSAQVWHGVDPERLEAVISAAASVGDLYCRQGVAVGLTVAGSLWGSPRGLSLPPQRGEPQRQRILTALAWARPGGGDAASLSAALGRLRTRVTAGTPVLVFTTFYDPGWRAAVEGLARRGGRLTWVAVAFRGPYPALPGVSVRTWTPRAGREEARS
jgi:uncharacterized protein (DUF58 family)